MVPDANLSSQQFGLRGNLGSSGEPSVVGAGASSYPSPVGYQPTQPISGPVMNNAAAASQGGFA